MATREVRRTYLQMHSPSELRRVSAPADAPELSREAPCSLELSRALYHEVGRAYHWRDRDALASWKPTGRFSSSRRFQRGS